MLSDGNEEIQATKAAVELANDNGIDLETIDGSGNDGRITKGDVKEVIEDKDGEQNSVVFVTIDIYPEVEMDYTHLDGIDRVFQFEDNKFVTDNPAEIELLKEETRFIERWEEVNV